MDIDRYLRKIMPSREEVDRFLSREVFSQPGAGNAGWTYNSGLGWILKDSVRDDGVDGSRTYYHYEKNGCRKRINASDAPCRIHAYGNSFTHCDQVSDGETWQEYLAAHIREPIMNFGVGGYGVYQAYLRMKLMEEQERADYVILNVWHDDHFRSLDSWRSIRFGFRTPCGFTLPYLEVDEKTGEVREKPNVCPTSQSAYWLTDRDFVLKTFRDDRALRDMKDSDINVGEGGVYWRPEMMSPGFVRSALLASSRIVEWCERDTARRGQKFMLILSHGEGIIRSELLGQPRWDETFVDSLAGKPYPVLDLRDAHRQEYAGMTVSVDEYLKRYYIGHYSPTGNFFFAQAFRKRLVEWLDPCPAPYSPGPRE
jgi:hypothetical protein